MGRKGGSSFGRIAMKDEEIVALIACSPLWVKPMVPHPQIVLALDQLLPILKNKVLAERTSAANEHKGRSGPGLTMQH